MALWHAYLKLSVFLYFFSTWHTKCFLPFLAIYRPAPHIKIITQIMIQIPSLTFNVKSCDANYTVSSVVQMKSWAKQASFGKQ